MQGGEIQNSQIRNTTFTIVATGDSAQDWTSNGQSIGCNDAFKFGKPLDSLLICNRPETFSEERRKTILATNPKEFYSHKSNWLPYFPQWKKIRLHTWAGTLHQYNRNDGPHAYSSNTSPIIAITLAYNLGAKEIIIWGVDFQNHKIFHQGNPETKREVNVYLQVFEQLKEKGVQVWRGADGTAFDEHIRRRLTIDQAGEMVADSVKCSIDALKRMYNG